VTVCRSLPKNGQGPEEIGRGAVERADRLLARGNHFAADRLRRQCGNLQRRRRRIARHADVADERLRARM
jgi:hypothetical protein